MSHTPSTPPSTPQHSGGGSTPGWSAVPPSGSEQTPAGQAPAWQPAGPKPSRRKAWLTHGVTALVALVVGAGIGGNGDSGGTDGSAAPGPTVTVTKTAAPGGGKDGRGRTGGKGSKPKPAKKSGPATTVGGEGQYLVGEEMRAGTYKTAGPDKDNLIDNCYWARTKDASGEFEAIIANGNLQGQGRVTVNKGEYFESKGCQEWTRVG